jgi:hypothetical protein
VLAVPEGKNGPSTFKVYPNPASDTFFLQNPFQNQTTYSILDMAGRIVGRGKIAGNEPRFHIDVSTLSSGLYLINLKSGNRSVSNSLIIR